MRAPSSTVKNAYMPFCPVFVGLSTIGAPVCLAIITTYRFRRSIGPVYGGLCRPCLPRTSDCEQRADCPGCTTTCLITYCRRACTSRNNNARLLMRGGQASVRLDLCRGLELAPHCGPQPGSATQPGCTSTCLREFNYLWQTRLYI